MVALCGLNAQYKQGGQDHKLPQRLLLLWRSMMRACTVVLQLPGRRGYICASRTSDHTGTKDRSTSYYQVISNLA